LDIKEYISSGILELYVFDQLTPSERSEVERLAALHPEVKEEIFAISQTAEQYAMIQGVKTPADVKTGLFEKIKAQNEKLNTPPSISKPTTPPSGGKKWNGLHSILLLTALTGFGLYMYKAASWQKERLQFQKDQLVCDSIQRVTQNQYAIINDLRNEHLSVARLAATPKYKDVVMHLHTSKLEKFNYIQLNNLPPIGADQAYQLWALKDGQPPMPLNVFGDKDGFVKVDFIDEVTTYAITIEKKEGATTPNMENLLGTFGI
jgi:anti-sigma-K factor RskA